jgi:hypothetical protein
MVKYVLLGSVLLIGCTDAEWSKLAALGDRAHVVCYSGGKPIYDGYSTGKPLSEDGSDGYFFRDEKDQVLREVSGECVISYEG